MKLLLINPNISTSVLDLIRAEAVRTAAPDTQIEVVTAAAGVTGVRMREMVASAWPFIALMYGVLIACMLFPPLVTALPRAMDF
jgi:Asp/Glu/hydantoin racemase